MLNPQLNFVSLNNWTTKSEHVKPIIIQNAKNFYKNGKHHH